ncbi:hypothetical protein Psch_02756 [Pelotomaculum schinkii]|uniref:Uncharacterized protein n=1 Tax=Pelotomaculum schinkii TaxID=78350 RepID=A0A4Y7R9T3_9FIRM|nr:hypothetical protein [Pelotomaculum schinkii]TEB05715.1 hypothetical protein Psch_02756 [Pelotomaculum schinkii]
MEAAFITAEPGRPIHNHTFPITGQMIYEAVISADAMGKRIKAGLPVM